MARSEVKGKSNLLRKVEERTLAKKLKEQNNVVSYLPNELISNILLRLPLQSLSSMRYVSKQWYDVIRDPDFIYSHLCRSESVLIFRKKIPSCPKKPLQAKQVICKEKLEQSKAFSVEAHLLKTESVGVCLHLMSNSMQQFSIHFVEFKEGKKEIMNYGLSCSKNIRATCNGLILLDNALKEGGLIVMNPVIRKLRPLPVGTLCASDRESYGFAYNEVAGEYKVVHLFFDELSYIGCETLCLGTMKWRAVSGPSFGLFQSFDHNPVSAIGALHWIPQVRGSLYLVSMELKNDKFHRWSLPKAAGRHDRIIKKGDFLCFVTREHPLSRIDMWIRKGLFGERWTLHHRITKGFFPVFVQRRCNTNSWRSLTKKTTRRVSSGLVEVEKNGIGDEACELVSGVELTIGEDHDSIQAYLCKAVKNNNRTGVVLLSDIFGFEDSSTRDFAYRVACNGYNVIVPDLFRGDPWGKDRPKTLFEEWLVKQDLNRVLKDINSATKWMVDEFMAAGISNKLAVIGFCYGGGRVIDILAQDQGNCFGIGVSFYGTRINQSVVPNVKVPILFISGDNDPLCHVNVLRDIEKSICKESQVVVFKGRGHGFVHRPGSLEEDEDAEEAFALMRNWLHDALIVKN